VKKKPEKVQRTKQMQDSFLIPDATSWKFSAASRCRSSCFPQSVKHKQQQQQEIEEEAPLCKQLTATLVSGGVARNTPRPSDLCLGR
jgi:hypothetical protein